MIRSVTYNVNRWFWGGGLREWALRPSVAGKWGGWDILGAVHLTAANGKRYFDRFKLNAL
jgi:hypothetical protein